MTDRDQDSDHDSPNTDFGNMVNPPADVGMERVSDDNDLDPAGDGVTDTPLRRPYELMARRDDLARRLGDILLEMEEWAEEDGSEEARSLAEDLGDLYQRLGEPSEDTDLE